MFETQVLKYLFTRSIWKSVNFGKFIFFFPKAAPTLRGSSIATRIRQSFIEGTSYGLNFNPEDSEGKVKTCPTWYGLRKKNLGFYLEEVSNI